MIKRSFPQIVAIALIAACAISTAAMANGSLMTKRQMIWTLSDISNINAGLVDSEANLENHAKDINKIVKNSTFRNYMGSWDVVWGPVIVDKRVWFKYRTANTMYVAKGVDPSNQKPIYVVAIAGTNIVSHYGWFVEDFEVDTTVPWPPEAMKPEVHSPLVPANISEGTATGVSILWNMEDSGKTLLEFLKQENFASSTELAVAGHSLGGALAPTLALALEDTRSTWTQGSNVTVATYPTAGPTPGDEAFAKLVAHTLGSNYQSLVNTLDVVPHAWQKSTAEKIATIYENIDITTCHCSGTTPATGIPNNPVVNGIGYWITNYPGGTDYQRIGVDGTFSGPNNNAQACAGIVKEAKAVKNAKLTRKGYALYELRIVLQKIMRNMTGNQKAKITCNQIAGLFQFLGEFGYQHTTVYGGPDGFNIPADLKTVIAKYINLADADQKAVGTIIYDFLVKVNKYIKSNPPG